MPLKKISMIRPCLTVFGLVALFLLLPACAAQMPADAREALVAYWDSLPAEPGVSQEFVRAWPGEGDQAEVTPWAPEMEVWCVIAEISAPNNAEVDGEQLVWIVIRETPESGWNAALLATMSATWPYESCGQR